MLRAAGGKPGRYMQCFMYVRSCPEDNHYAHPLDLVVVLDMNTKQVRALLPALAGCISWLCCLSWLCHRDLSVAPNLCSAGMHLLPAGHALLQAGSLSGVLCKLLCDTASGTADASSQCQQFCNSVCPVQVLEFLHHDGPPPALPPLNSNFHAKLVEQERGFR